MKCETLGPSWVAFYRQQKHRSKQVETWAGTGGYVKFTLSKEMMPHSFNGTDRMKFSDWEFEMSNSLSARDHEHTVDILSGSLRNRRTQYNGDGSGRHETTRGF